MDMKTGSSRAILGATVVWLAGVTVPAGGQAVPAPKPLMAEDVFKNVQVLKGIPADEFMGTMSVVLGGSGRLLRDVSRRQGRLGQLCARYRSEKADGAPHGADDGRHQSDELRRTAGGDVLHLSSRQRSPQDHAEPRRRVIANRLRTARTMW